MSNLSTVTMAQTAATDPSLGSLADRFASLPLPSLAPAMVLLLGGLLLLLAGRHLLRPVLVVTTIVTGAVLGAPILGSLAPGLGRLGWTVVGALLGLVVVAATWRLMYGAAAAVVFGCAASIVALLAIDAGWIDARVTTGSANAATHEEHSSVLGQPVRGQSGRDQNELPFRHDDQARAALLERTPVFLQPLVDWADARWHAEPKQSRTFLAAAAAGGGFIGLILGSWLPNTFAAALTSLVGSIFTLVGAAPLLARVTERFSMPERPLGWLLLWASLALAGWLLQTWRGDPDADDEPDLEQQAQTRRDAASPQ
ncbi:MAG: hypothetical protein QM516_08840 [Limnohabitans sp.]|nr:hypothetical protein [Limnohabitans sp.]